MLPQMDLNMALMKGDFNLLRNLVESGANVNIRDKDGRTALINCCLHDGQNWALGSARLLLTYGAKVSSCDKVGRNALMYAIMYTREKLVRLFLEALDCDLSHTDKWNHTALWYANSSGNSAIKTMLRQILNKYCFLPEVPDKKEIIKDNRFCRPGPIICPNVLQKSPKTSQQLQIMCSTNNAKSKLNKGICGSKKNGTCYVLPYKTLSADLWEKRMTFYKNVKQHSSSSLIAGATDLSSMKHTFRFGTGTQINEKVPRLPKQNSNITAQIEQESSQLTNWHQDFSKLIAMFENQHCPSYCKKAEILPPNQQRYLKPQKGGIGEYMDSQFLRKRRCKGRRLSFDTLDVLRNKNNTKGSARRRCSVAVIPLIKIQGQKSISSEDERQKMKRLLPLSKHVPKKM